jgi:hypothetical protein
VGHSRNRVVRPAADDYDHHDDGTASNDDDGTADNDDDGTTDDDNVQHDDDAAANNNDVQHDHDAAAHNDNDRAATGPLLYRHVFLRFRIRATAEGSTRSVALNHRASRFTSAV